jgi:hypothetical protein
MAVVATAEATVAAATQLWATAAVTVLEATASPVMLAAGEAATTGEGTAAVDMGLADFTASAAFVCQLQLEKFAHSGAAIPVPGIQCSAETEGLLRSAIRRE